MGTDKITIGHSASVETFKGCLRQPKLKQRITNRGKLNLPTRTENLETGCRFSTVNALTMHGNSTYDIRTITEVALSDLYFSIDFARTVVAKETRLIAIKTETEEIAFHLEKRVLKMSTKSGTAAIIARNVEQSGSISTILRDGSLSVGFNGSRRLSTFVNSNSTS